MATEEELIAALTPLVLALVGLALQWLKSKDSDKHGDSFLVMLKGAGETFDSIATVVPAIKPYVVEYKAFVTEADKIWNSGGMTADDIKELEREFKWWKLKFETALAEYRKLKAPA